MADDWPAQEPGPEVLTSHEPRRRSRSFAIGAAGVAAGLTVGVVGIAAATGTPEAATTQLGAGAPAQAQTSPSQSPSVSPSSEAVPAPRLPGDKRGLRRGPRGQKALGAGVLHGEFVTRKPDGGYQTVQTQQGAVTAVSATSITVKSEDGFTRSYAVTKDTLVNAGSEGITSIAVNARVRVHALGAGSTPTAAQVIDEAKMQAKRDSFAPHRKKPTADATPTI